MRKLFYTTAALSVLLATLMAANAAEVPPVARPVAPAVYLPPPFTWTGFYIGPNLGGAWSQASHGVTRQELMEAIWVAAEMRAGAAYAHSTIAVTAIDEAEGLPPL
jgi:hypothetical protein